MKKRILSLVMSIVMAFSLVGVMPKIEAAESIESAVQWAIDRANDNSCGYSQSNRWGPTYYDCSSFVITALKNGGFDVGGATYTQNMRSNLTTRGFTWIPWSQISGVWNLKKGDILLNDSSDTSKQHTEFYIGNNQNVGAHTSKRAWNDQVSVSGFYIHPWTGILRYNGNNPIPPTNAKLSLDKSSYSLGEKISFKISWDNCDEMFLPVDYNGKRIEFINVTGKNAYTYTPSQAGTYGFYIVGRNPNGECSSDYCEVKVFSGKPTNAKLTLDKSSYNLGEKISFEFSCDNIGELFLPVDYNGKRIEFINVTGTDAYTYAPSQAGTYGFYIIGRNSNGDCSSEYKEIKVHKYESKLIASTCIEKGYTLHTCSICGDNYKDTYVNAKGHSWSDWTTTKKATCTADGIKTRKCSVCGKTETSSIAKTGHKYASKIIAPTCTEKGYTLHTCSVCSDNYKDTYADAKGHSFAAKEEKDYKLFTCSGCEFSYKVTFKGDGTAESPYLISSKEDLLCLSELMLNETTALLFRNKCYKQTNDIDLKNILWTPLGKFRITGDKNSACYFEKGFVYDGDNHNIFNLNVNQAYGYAGLFGKVNKGTIKNLAVYGNVQTSTAKGYGTGGIVGELAYGSTVSNCCFIGNVTSENCSGGIAGNSWRGGNIINCYFSGNVTSTNHAGGIVGVIHDKDYEPEVHNVIENCYFIGEISGKTTGGIVGVHLETGSLNKNNTSDIINCYYLKNSAEKGFGEGNANKNDSTPLISPIMKQISTDLGKAYSDNNYNTINSGFPVFNWQMPSKIKGDINNDGNMMVSDIVIMQKYLTRKTMISESQLISADVNNDGVVNAFDSIIAKRTVLNN